MRGVSASSGSTVRFHAYRTLNPGTYLLPHNSAGWSLQRLKHCNDFRTVSLMVFPLAAEHAAEAA